MINLENYPDDIALLFSGGVESTLLLYLISTGIVKHYPNKYLTLYILDRHNKPIDKAHAVVNMVFNKTKLSVPLKFLSIPKVLQHREISLASKIIGLRHSIVVCGFNKYPTDDSIRPKYLVSIDEDRKLNFPFAHIEKSIIIQEFFNLGISDILSFTHSCGSNLDSPCGKCFNCRERIWAYNTIKKPVNLGQ
jgi:7-cyano-7-deazaguanine synthase in queuosine biosynthesis